MLLSLSVLSDIKGYAFVRLRFNIIIKPMKVYYKIRNPAILLLTGFRPTNLTNKRFLTTVQTKFCGNI